MSFFDNWCGFFTGGFTLVAGASVITGGIVNQQMSAYVNGLFENLRNSTITFRDVTVNVSMGTAPYMPMHIGMDTPTEHFFNNETKEWLTNMVVSTGASFGFVSGSLMGLILLVGMALAGGIVYQQNQIDEMSERLDLLMAQNNKYNWSSDCESDEDNDIRLTTSATPSGSDEDEKARSDDENRPLLSGP